MLEERRHHTPKGPRLTLPRGGRTGSEVTWERPSAPKSRAGTQALAAAEAGNSLPCPTEEEAVVETEAILEAVAVIEAAAVTVEVMLAKAEAAVEAAAMTASEAAEPAGTVEAPRGIS